MREMGKMKMIPQDRLDKIMKDYLDEENKTHYLNLENGYVDTIEGWSDAFDDAYEEGILVEVRRARRGECYKDEEWIRIDY